MNKARLWLHRYEALLPPLIMILLSTFNHWWSDDWVTMDEGGNLMKAVLVAKGFHLYSEIWSDQPPILTFLLVPAEIVPYRPPHGRPRLRVACGRGAN
jgi:hypothetical protein